MEGESPTFFKKKKKRIPFTQINIYSLLPKTDEVYYILNIANTSIIGKSESKSDEIIFSSELEVDGYDLIRLNQSRQGGNVAF